jgi:hypothetical protein
MISKSSNVEVHIGIFKFCLQWLGWSKENLKAMNVDGNKCEADQEGQPTKRKAGKKAKVGPKKRAKKD